MEEMIRYNERIEERFSPELRRAAFLLEELTAATIVIRQV